MSNKNWSPSRGDKPQDMALVVIDNEDQRRLRCAVNENVFLEYPWAYVESVIVKRLCCKENSNFFEFKDKIINYNEATFLIGYASDEVICSTDHWYIYYIIKNKSNINYFSNFQSSQTQIYLNIICSLFSICLTAEARDSVARRNGEIARRIRKEALGKVRRHLGEWKTHGSGEEITEITSLVSSIQLLDAPIAYTINQASRVVKNLSDRGPDDARDGYVELVARVCDDDVEKPPAIAWMSTTSTFFRTNLESREATTQTYTGDPKDVESQYEDLIAFGQVDDANVETLTSTEDTVRNVTESNQSVASEITSTMKFNRDVVQRLMEVESVVVCNAVFDLYTNDIDTIVYCPPSVEENFIVLDQKGFLVFNCDNEFLDVLWCPATEEVVAVTVTRDCVDSQHLRHRILIWSFENNYSPKIQLGNDESVSCVFFHSSISKDDRYFVFGGCDCGKLSVWCFTSKESEEIIIAPSFELASEDFHDSTIKQIHLVPPEYTILTEELEQSVNRADEQLATVSSDGTLTIYTLSDIFEEQKVIPFVKVSLNKPLSTFLFVVSENLSKDDNKELKLWLGTDSGELHIVDCPCIEDCFEKTLKVLERTANSHNEQLHHFAQVSPPDALELPAIHDGPIIQIVNCPQFPNVLLTLGGKIFAIWVCPKLLLLWRSIKHDQVTYYTCGCWSGFTAGLIYLSKSNGDVELWHLSQSTSGPVHLCTISGDPSIARVYSPCKEDYENELDVVAVGESNGKFHLYHRREIIPSKS